MNLFYLSENLEQLAEWHIDKHISKMQLEATQLLASALWVDKLLGYVPRKLAPEELKVINDEKHKEPTIEQRTFTRYLPTHINHPCAIWVRSSLENYYWTINYVFALNDEALYRGYKPHASCIEAARLPEPLNLKDIGFLPPAQAMPEAYKSSDAVLSYQRYYANDKREIASWKHRIPPPWWDSF